MAKHLLVAAATAAIFSANANAQAADCSTIDECQTQLRDAQLAGVTVLVNKLQNSMNGQDLPIPPNTEVQPDPYGIYTWRPVSGAKTTPDTLMKTVGGPVAWTLTIAGGQFDPTNPEGILTLATNGTGDTKMPFLSFAVSSSAGLKVRYFDDDWFALWDPPQQTIANNRYAGYYLIFRFREDTKLMVDMFLKKDPNADCSGNNCMRYGVLLDNGWPVSTYPSGRGAKLYPALASLQLGAFDPKTKSVLPTISVSDINTFKGYLTENQVQTLLYNHAQFPQAQFTYRKLTPENQVCNTGSVYSAGPDSTSPYATLCGDRTSPIAEWLDPLMTDFSIIDSEGRALTASSDGTVSMKIAAPNNPAQIWHITPNGKLTGNYRLQAEGGAEGQYLEYQKSPRPDAPDTWGLTNVADSTSTIWHFDKRTSSIRPANGMGESYYYKNGGQIYVEDTAQPFTSSIFYVRPVPPIGGSRKKPEAQEDAEEKGRIEP